MLQSGQEQTDTATAQNPRNIVSLSEASAGSRCRICGIHSDGAMRRRLLDLGLIPGAEVDFVRVAPLNDPIELRVGNAFVSLRRVEAEKIDVELIHG